MNDIDLWNDIEELEKLGKTEQAFNLMKLYHYRFIEYDENKFNEVKNDYERKYKDKINV